MRRLPLSALILPLTISVLYCVTLSLCVAAPAHAQNPPTPPGTIIMSPRGQVSSDTSRPSASTRTIIVLKAPSVAEVVSAQRTALRTGSGKLTAQALRAARSHGLALRQAHTSARQKLAQQRVPVAQALAITINALIVDKHLSLEDAQRILPGQVRSVVMDHEVKAFLSESVPLTNAPEVWKLTGESGLPLTGQGMRIGIIDTGIDYTHADLGGCARTSDINSGGCAKVAGGYDFVNSDSDPFDDHGHGTHCAATAAGKGALSGVAPDATLYAYKVLSSDGSGWSSDIMTAIERSVDPNGDGNFNDHLDVISLSLGSSGGSPNDSLSLALDRAVSLGVVAVVAAGNAGPDPRTIGSPGTSRHAITVGAFKKDKSIASFSSRGPVTFEQDGKRYSISKPDVVAPGVDICAAISSESTIPSGTRLCLDSNHFKLSGTSMATPHVAGLAALLRQARPSWTPEEIKAAIKSSASRTLITSDIGVADAGSGAVDALAALSAPRGVAAIEEVRVAATSGEMTLQAPLGWSYSISITPKKSLNLFDGASWEPLTSGITTATRFVTSVNTTTVGQGDYTVRLQAVSASGDILTDYSEMKIQRFEITSPVEADVVNSRDPLLVQFSKLADIPIESLAIEYSINDGDWRTDGVTTSVSSLSGTIQLPQSSSIYGLKVRLRVTSPGREDTLLSDGIRVDSNLKPGFPIRVPADCGPTWWSSNACQPNWVLHPIVADLDGDKREEILVWRNSLAPKANEILIFSHKGELVRSIPVKAHPYQNSSAAFHFTPWPLLVTDLDGDTKPEIVVVESFNLGELPRPFNSRLVQVVMVYDALGNLRPGFPRILPGINQSFITADLNHDGRKEIIVQGRSFDVLESPLGTHVHIVSDDGTTTAHVVMPNESSRVTVEQLQEGGNPVVGNFDLDSDLEVAIFRSSALFTPPFSLGDTTTSTTVIDWDQFGNVSSAISSFPGFLFGSAAVLDENNDGTHDLSLTLYPDDTVSRVGHIRFNGGSSTSSEFSTPLYVNDCDVSSSEYCGVYGGGFALGRLKGASKVSPLTFAGNFWGTRSQLHRYEEGQLAGTGGPSFSAFDPQSPAVTADITGDGENDIIFAANGDLTLGPKGIVALTSESNYVESRIFATERNFYAQGFISPTARDIDNDGKLDIIAGSLGDNYPSKYADESSKNRFSIYAYTTDGATSNNGNEWASFLGNPDHNACLDCDRPIVPLGETPPLITAQPKSEALPVGTSAVISVTASGQALRYQWERASGQNDWLPIFGATTNSLTISTADGLAYSYRVRVSGRTRSAISDAALISIKTNPENTACPAGSLKPFAGICGCKVFDNDADQDGTIDCLERRPYKFLGKPDLQVSPNPRRVTITLPAVKEATQYTVTLLRMRPGDQGVQTFRRTGTRRRYAFTHLRGGNYKVVWSATISGVPGLPRVVGSIPPFSVR